MGQSQSEIEQNTIYKCPDDTYMVSVFDKFKKRTLFLGKYNNYKDAQIRIGKFTKTYPCFIGKRYCTY